MHKNSPQTDRVYLRAPVSRARVDADLVVLAARVCELRAEKGLTQEHLAHLAGVGVNTVGNLERAHVVGTDKLVRVMRVLGQRLLDVQRPDSAEDHGYEERMIEERE
jgi:transcriptional regulator with XRE-family HTH domain